MDPLVESFYDVLKAVRLLKQRHPVTAPVGVLTASLSRFAQDLITEATR